MVRAPQSLEKRFLILSSVGNLLIGIAAVVVAGLSSSQAVLLDGTFNLIYFVMGLLSLRITRLIARGEDSRFPYGYAVFEPLINGVKGFMVLGLTALAFLGAIDALLAGGRPISGGIAVLYGIFASTICWVQALVSRRGYKVTASPMLGVDAENWVVNAAIST